MNIADRIGDWMQLASGRPFWPLDPRAEDIDIFDIAASLSRTCRFGGHLRDDIEWYSVAEHCVHVSYVVPEGLEMHGLLHDASEALGLADIVRPTKRGLPGYKHLEAASMRAVAVKFGLDHERFHDVKVADDAVLMAEHAQLLAPSPSPWSVKQPPASITCKCWAPHLARVKFLARFHELKDRKDFWC